MSSAVDSILDHVERIDQDAQLTGTLLENRSEDSSLPPYFYLRHLVNPQQAYWKHIGQEPEITDELRRLFARGNRMERVAHQAFSRIDGFTGIESVLDGAENGVPGVRGRIDFRFQDSLVEFKTTEYTIEESEDIWELAPQDIEQLLFYSALWTREVSEHYLIYYLVGQADPLRIFRVEISNHGMIQNQLESRKTNLERAIEVGDPTIVRQCRYLEGACHIDAEGICDCTEYDELNTDPLQRVTDVERDGELEERIQSVFEEIEDQNNPVRPWDLETPRRWYGRQIGERERGEWTPNDRWVPDAIYNADLLPGPLQSEYIPHIEEPLHFSPKGKMIQRSRTTGEGEETRWVPALTWYKERFESPPEPAQIRNQIMQVGCACGLANVGTGYCIIELPNSDADVVVYRIVFSDPAGIEGKIRERLENLNSAIQSGDPSGLPECPGWLEDMGCEDCFCN